MTRPPPPLPAYRRRQIVLLLERDGYVALRTLHQRFPISDASLRRDLTSIAEAGYGVRTRGGLRSHRAAGGAP